MCYMPNQCLGWNSDTHNRWTISKDQCLKDHLFSTFLWIWISTGLALDSLSFSNSHLHIICLFLTKIKGGGWSLWGPKILPFIKWPRLSFECLIGQYKRGCIISYARPPCTSPLFMPRPACTANRWIELLLSAWLLCWWVFDFIWNRIGQDKGTQHLLAHFGSWPTNTRSTLCVLTNSHVEHSYMFDPDYLINPDTQEVHSDQPKIWVTFRQQSRRILHLFTAQPLAQ